VDRQTDRQKEPKRYKHTEQWTYRQKDLKETDIEREDRQTERTTNRQIRMIDR
jgi:hypothetical protein